MEGGLMKARDQIKLETIYKIEKSKLSSKDGEILLQVSERTLRRYRRGYRENGIGFLRHGNAMRKPLNKLPDDLKRDIQRLMQEKYFDFNMSHAREKIKEELGVSIGRETFRKWCHEIGMTKKSKKRRGRPRYYRQRMSQPGLLLQMDGSTHRWFGDRESCLVATIDDATSEVVYAEFFEGETTLACLKVLKNVVLKKGIFKVLYVDKAGVYGGIKRNNFSQVERALQELGIEVMYAHSPEAKGRIERLFGTLQDRLVAEMRLNKIRTLAQANQYLQQSYLPHHHNPTYSVLAQNPHSAYVATHPSMNLDGIFCVKECRIVGRDHTISVQGKKYMIADQLRFSIHRQRIEIRYNKPGGGWQAFFADQELTMLEIKMQKRAAAAC